MISPYHIPVNRNLRFLTDLLVTVDERHNYGYHARKLMCKLRETMKDKNSYIFYNQFPNK